MSHSCVPRCGHQAASWLLTYRHPWRQLAAPILINCCVLPGCTGLQAFTAKGRFLRAWGSEGTKPGQVGGNGMG